MRIGEREREREREREGERERERERVGARRIKKRAFFVPFILSEENFFKTCVLYQCTVY